VRARKSGGTTHENGSHIGACAVCRNGGPLVPWTGVQYGIDVITMMDGVYLTILTSELSGSDTRDSETGNPKYCSRWL